MSEWTLETSYRGPYVALTSPDGEEYFFQGEEAAEIQDEAEKEAPKRDNAIARRLGYKSRYELPDAELYAVCAGLL